MDNLLPPEYQEQLDRATRRQRIAEAMMKQGQQPIIPQQGRVASRVGIMPGLASIFASGMGSHMMNSGAEDATKVRQQYSDDSNADLARLQALPPDEAIKAGQLSRFGQSKAFAQQLYKSREDQRKAKAGVLGPAGQTTAALAALDGKDFSLAPPKEPEVYAVDDPANPGRKINATKNFDKYGFPKVSLGAQGTNVSLVNDSKVVLDQNKEVMDVIGKTLTERRGKATAAKDLYAYSNQAIDALETGATTGGLEGMKQAVRKGLQAFNVTLPETASVEQLSMALGQSVLGKAKEIYPVSNADMITLQKMVGSIDTDPTALVKAIALAQSMGIRELQGYNDYAAENQKNIKPEVQALFSGATSGYEVPQQLTGPMAYQMEILRQLQRNGVDVSNYQFGDGTKVGKNAKFNIDVTQGFPGVQKPPASPANPPAQGLSAAEKAELDALRKRFKR